MKKVLYFHLAGCPYCRQADSVIEELVREHPQYKDVVFERVDEFEHPEIADRYDYDLNPCMYIDGEKIYEGYQGETREECRIHIEAVMKKALESDKA